MELDKHARTTQLHSRLQNGDQNVMVPKKFGEPHCQSDELAPLSISKPSLSNSPTAPPLSPAAVLPSRDPAHQLSMAACRPPPIARSDRQLPTHSPLPFAASPTLPPVACPGRRLPGMLPRPARFKRRVAQCKHGRHHLRFSKSGEVSPVPPHAGPFFRKQIHGVF